MAARSIDGCFDWPRLARGDIRAVQRYLEDRRPLSLDRREGIYAELEEGLEQAFGCQHALLFNSGTSALHAAYFALRLPRGTRVACPVFTYPATVMPMLGLGLVPHFCDCDPTTANVTAETFEKAIVDGVGGVVLTHMWGLPCDMGRILEKARSAGVPVLEDASHAPGAKIGGKRVGCLGDVGIISFQANKLVCAGEGGVLLTNRRDIYERAVTFAHNQARIVDLGPDHEFAEYAPYGYGLKLRMHPLAAVLALRFLDRLQVQGKRQREIASYLDAVLEQSLLAQAPVREMGVERVYYSYKPLIRISGGSPPRVETVRSHVVEALRGQGLPARVPDSQPLADHPMFSRGLGALFGLALPAEGHTFPGAQSYFSRSITIPFPNHANDTQAQTIAQLLKDGLDEVARDCGP